MSDSGVPLVSVRIDDKRCTYCLDFVDKMSEFYGSEVEVVSDDD